MAQIGKVWRMGLCHVGLDHEPPSLHPLKEELARRGYVDGRNLVFDWSNQATEATADIQIRDWLAKNYDLIVAFEDQCVRAAKAATSSIPIVFAHTSDPVQAGFIKSLSQPGGNITGPISNPILIGKLVEILKRFDPQLRRVLVLWPGLGRSADVRTSDRGGAATYPAPLHRWLGLRARPRG